MIFHVLILLTFEKRNAWLTNTKSNQMRPVRVTKHQTTRKKIRSRKACVRVKVYYHLSYYIINVHGQLRM